LNSAETNSVARHVYLNFRTADVLQLGVDLVAFFYNSTKYSQWQPAP